jgi:hypothetical protein
MCITQLECKLADMHKRLAHLECRRKLAYHSIHTSRTRSSTLQYQVAVSQASAGALRHFQSLELQRMQGHFKSAMNHAWDCLFVEVDDCLQYCCWVWSLPELVQGELFQYHYKLWAAFLCCIFRP